MAFSIGAPDKQELAQVVALADANRKWLGFLPASVIRELAGSGRCLVARDSGRIGGYVLFDLPGNDVRLTQLCVAPESRLRGVAEGLVSALSNEHADRRGLRLSCRSDWPADKVWPKLGFRPVSSRPGRGKTQETLTVWFRDHDNPDLFSFRPEPRLRLALDADVFSRIYGAQLGEDSDALALAPD